MAAFVPGDPTENRPYTRAILEPTAEADAVVPEIWPFEIANGIFVAYGEWLKNIALESLARKHNLSAYDVAYLVWLSVKNFL